MSLKNYAENHGMKIIIIFCFDRCKKRDQGKYCIYIESKDCFIECTPEIKPF